MAAEQEGRGAGMPWDRNQMAARAAQELQDGMYVNLGIGIPTLVANYVGDKDITLQSENGMLGMGPFPVSRAKRTPTSSTPASRRSPNCAAPRISTARRRSG
jgi:3-oxoacid CoA-transferase B subunit